MDKELIIEEKRSYTSRQYTPENIAEAISLFIAYGGSVTKTRNVIKDRWGYSPTEPTLRKWLQSSNEAMNLLDQRTLINLQSDVSYIIKLAYEQLVTELEEKNFPAGKLGTLYGIMVDKYILLNKIRNSSIKESGNDIIGDESYEVKDDEISRFLDEDSIPDD